MFDPCKLIQYVCITFNEYLITTKHFKSIIIFIKYCYLPRCLKQYYPKAINILNSYHDIPRY